MFSCVFDQIDRMQIEIDRNQEEVARHDRDTLRCFHKERASRDAATNAGSQHSTRSADILYKWETMHHRAVQHSRKQHARMCDMILTEKKLLQRVRLALGALYGKNTGHISSHGQPAPGKFQRPRPPSTKIPDMAKPSPRYQRAYMPKHPQSGTRVDKENVNPRPQEQQFKCAPVPKPVKHSGVLGHAQRKAEKRYPRPTVEPAVEPELTGKPKPMDTLKPKKASKPKDESKPAESSAKPKPTAKPVPKPEPSSSSEISGKKSTKSDLSNVERFFREEKSRRAAMRRVRRRGSVQVRTRSSYVLPDSKEKAKQIWKQFKKDVSKPPTTDETAAKPHGSAKSRPTAAPDTSASRPSEKKARVEPLEKAQKRTTTTGSASGRDKMAPPRMTRRRSMIDLLFPMDSKKKQNSATAAPASVDATPAPTVKRPFVVPESKPVETQAPKPTAQTRPKPVERQQHAPEKSKPTTTQQQQQSEPATKAEGSTYFAFKSRPKLSRGYSMPNVHSKPAGAYPQTRRSKADLFSNYPTYKPQPQRPRPSRAAPAASTTTHRAAASKPKPAPKHAPKHVPKHAPKPAPKPKDAPIAQSNELNMSRDRAGYSFKADPMSKVPARYAKMSIREMKARLVKKFGVKKLPKHVTEKADIVQLLMQEEEKLAEKARKEREKKRQARRAAQITKEVERWGRRYSLHEILNKINKSSRGHRLHVDRRCSYTPIHKAFKRACLKIHPDKNMGSFESHTEATEKFKVVNELFTDFKQRVGRA